MIKEKDKKEKTIVLGETLLKAINKFSTDRNRTSPFAFVDNRFEFRMPGSSTSIGVCNTILNTAVADKISELVSKLENSNNIYEDAQNLIIEEFEKHKKIIYHGNGYSTDWVEEAEYRGLKDIKSTPEALKMFTEDKAIKLFEKYSIYTEKELKSRYAIKMQKYSYLTDIEACTMLSMAKTKILPASLQFSENLMDDIKGLKELGLNADTETAILTEARKNIDGLYKNINMLSRKLEEARKIEDYEEKAVSYRDEVIKFMDKLRNNADNLEQIVPKDLWPIPTYVDIFLED